MTISQKSKKQLRQPGSKPAPDFTRGYREKLKAGDRITINANHPYAGNEYEVAEVRENGWVLTTTKQRSPSNGFSTCPGCASQTIELEQGCGVCGWQRDLLLGDKQDSTHLSPSKISQKRSHSAREVSPSKTRRRKGEGSGSIHPKPIVRNGKTYHQHWYHYEIWEGGDRLVKRTRYIPQHLLSRVQRLDGEKAPVREILKLLGIIR